VILQIKDGQVIAYYKDGTQFTPGDGSELVQFDREIQITVLPFPDPRTDAEKALAYRDKRRQEYPPIADQLDMIYWDQANGTTTWRDTIAAVKAKYPKP
jgi:hypothetical protein